MLARTPWSPKLRADSRPKPRRLTKERRRHLIEAVAGILKAGEPTKFSFEAACRHALRAALCMSGWRWEAAAVAAADVVEAALNQIGAVRPTWQQGQPEWTQDGFAPIERAHCIRCFSPLPEGHFKFCSALCAHAHKAHIRRMRCCEETTAYDRAIRATERLER